jgi:electron transport complex protein RnfE
MSEHTYREIAHNGLWKQNAGLIQLLGLCPLLAISTTVVNAVSLGLATTLVMGASSGSISLIRNIVPKEIRIAVFILIIAALVTAIQLLMNAFVHPLYLVLGIFIPLITTNCIVLARAEAFASKARFLPSVFDGFIMGIGLTLVLSVLGGMREVVGKGTLFGGLDLVFGPQAKDWVIHIMPSDYPGVLAAVLPPGAFIGLGLLIAGKNWLDARAAQRVSFALAAKA